MVMLRVPARLGRYSDSICRSDTTASSLDSCVTRGSRDCERHRVPFVIDLSAAQPLTYSTILDADLNVPDDLSKWIHWARLTRKP